jgi:Protein of unknown function (DUF5818)
MRKLFFSILLGLAVLSPEFLPAQNTAPSQASTAQAPKYSSNFNKPMQRFHLAFYEGKIAKIGGRYVLKNSDHNMVYKLDDQALARKYVGKQVSVRGKLDPKTSMIHVAHIGGRS